MDNSNNPNTPNNPNPAPPFGTPPAPISPPPPPPFPPAGEPLPSWPPPPQPTIPPTAPAPTWPSDPIQSIPTPAPFTPDPTPAWTPPVSAQPEPPTPLQPEPTPVPSGTGPTPIQSEPTVSNPWSNPQPSMDTWTPPAPSEPGVISEPTPTFTPPDTSPVSSISEPSPAVSPVNPTQPSWMMSNQEAAPTDLSHLISSNQQEPAPGLAAESLVVPTAGATPEVPNLPTETRRGIPKWLIGLGVGLLIIVLGASAYFILGIGQPSKGTTSLPATTAPQTNQVKPPLPITTPVAQPTPTATDSANFGQLQGSGTRTATRAGDLIPQR